MDRKQMVAQLADTIASLRLRHPVRVGIDGVDASGKTMLADELADALESRGRAVIRVSVDSFHNPRNVRYRRGRLSPCGYYEDSFDLGAIISCVLEPLGPHGDLRYRRAHFDFRTDSPVDGSWHQAAPDSVVLFEGVFLHRPELLPHWDFSIFVHADFDVTLRRAQVRDRDLLGGPDEIERIYRARYIPGQKIYLAAERPSEKATVVIDNNDVENPELKINRAIDGTARMPKKDLPSG